MIKIIGFIVLLVFTFWMGTRFGRAFEHEKLIQYKIKQYNKLRDMYGIYYHEES